jgi:hypothetical protein
MLERKVMNQYRQLTRNTFIGQQFGSAQNDTNEGLAILGNGVVVSTGWTNGPLYEQNVDNQFNAIVQGDSDDGSGFWDDQFGPKKGDAKALAIAVDSQDHAATVGWVNGSLYSKSFGKTDCFITCYRYAGAFSWALQFGSSKDDSLTAVTIDSAGDVIVGGLTNGDLYETNLGDVDIILSKYSFEPDFQWGIQLGTPLFDSLSSIVSDEAGDIYAVGSTSGDLFSTNQGGTDAFIFKISGVTGDLIWSEQVGSLSNDEFTSITIYQDNTLLVGGWTEGNLYGERQGGVDYTCASYSTNGESLWSLQNGTAGNDTVTAISAVDEDSNFIISGFTLGDLFGSNAGGKDFFVALLSVMNGDFINGSQIGTSSDDVATGVGMDDQGNAIVTRYTFGSLFQTNLGGSDVFITEVDLTAPVPKIHKSPYVASGTIKTGGIVIAVISALVGIVYAWKRRTSVTSGGSNNSTKKKYYTIDVFEVD